MSSKSLAAGGVITAIALLLVGGFLFLIWGWGFLSGFETFFRYWTIPVLIIGGIVVLGALTFYFIGDDSALGAVLSGFGLLVLLAAGLAFFITGNYRVYSTYAEDMKTTEQVTNYADRAPWVVANNYSSRDQGDIIGTREGVHYVPNQRDAKAEKGNGDSRYTTLITKNHWLHIGGYQAIQSMNMPVSGQIPSGKTSYCKFEDGKDKRLNNLMPTRDLSRLIHAKKAFLHWDNDDAYGYCEDGKPIVVVPVYQQKGFFTITKSPYGAAVYKDGKLDLYDAAQLQKEGIEGPTYPRSVASEQRNSINAGSGFGNYWNKSFGYDTTGKDKEDSNAENQSEFLLIGKDENLQYVTPLTPKGSSTSITAITEIPAQNSEKGLAPIVVNTYTNLPSTSTLTTNIRESSVNGDNNWTTRWANGMGVYEILPGKNGHWVASIGQGQAVSYRADINPDGSVVVTNATTGQNSKDTDSGNSEKGKEESVTVKGGKPLKDMTEKELTKLIKDAADELEKKQAKDGN